MWVGSRVRAIPAGLQVALVTFSLAEKPGIVWGIHSSNLASWPADTAALLTSSHLYRLSDALRRRLAVPSVFPHNRMARSAKYIWDRGGGSEETEGLKMLRQFSPHTSIDGASQAPRMTIRNTDTLSISVVLVEIICPDNLYKWHLTFQLDSRDKC